jgi:hypothetical protein
MFRRMPPTTSSHLPARPAAPENALPGTPGDWAPKVERRQGHEAHRIANAVTFEHDPKSCSQLLFDLMQVLPREGMSLRTLIHSLGQRGLLMACMIFCLPSMLPIPMPGMSIPQGFVIGLLGLGLLLNRAPMLPERILNYRIAHRNLFLILEKGTQLFARIEKLSHPRIDILTGGTIVRAANGTLLVVGAALLMAPFPIPFSNVLPAYGILFLAFGMMQRDGWLIIASYAALLLSVLYIALVMGFGMAWISGIF